MLGEIFPLKIRGTAMGIATLTNWAGNFLVAQTFPMLQAVGEGLVFFIFAAVGIVAFFFALFLVPETKGRSLEEIETSLLRLQGKASV